MFLAAATLAAVPPADLTDRHKQHKARIRALAYYMRLSSNVASDSPYERADGRRTQSRWPHPGDGLCVAMISGADLRTGN